MLLQEQGIEVANGEFFAMQPSRDSASCSLKRYWIVSRPNPEPGTSDLSSSVPPFGKNEENEGDRAFVIGMAIIFVAIDRCQQPQEVIHIFLKFQFRKKFVPCNWG